MTFRVLDEGAEWCDYEQRTRLGPRTVRQRIRLDRSDPHHQVNAVAEGFLAGGTLTFDVRDLSASATEVTATLRTPLTPSIRFIGPILERTLGRSLARALGEDRNDIEATGGPIAAGTPTESHDCP